MSRRIITVITDFGTKDGYAGSMKGVIKSALPEAEIVDISHDITPFDINEAAYSIYNYYSSFPDGTVHLAVIDPGVGGERKGIIVKTDKYYFVGPDNGIFKLIFSFEEYEIYTILTDRFNNYSHTFHGRDIFAPVAAEIAGGIDLNEISVLEKNERAPVSLFHFDQANGQIETNAVTVDRFGNIITPFTKKDLQKTGKRIAGVKIKNKIIDSISAYYGQHNEKELLVLWNSLGFLEIAANRSSAVKLLDFDKNLDKIHIELK